MHDPVFCLNVGLRILVALLEEELSVQIEMGISRNCQMKGEVVA